MYNRYNNGFLTLTKIFVESQELMRLCLQGRGRSRIHQGKEILIWKQNIDNKKTYKK